MYHVYPVANTPTLYFKYSVVPKVHPQCNITDKLTHLHQTQSDWFGFGQSARRLVSALFGFRQSTRRLVSHWFGFRQSTRRLVV